MITYRQPFTGSWPITQRYGEIVPGVTYQGKPHTGIDYGCPLQTPILASADGEVMAAGWDITGFGFRVIIRHSANASTLYGHLDSISISVGDHVKQGQEIGLSGSTGYATGPHLHFEARRRWNDYTSHFDPISLPLMSFSDVEPVTDSHQLKGADKLGKAVKVVAPDGARRFNQDWTFPYPSAFATGQKLLFTGRTAKREGYPYTYCEVYEEPRKYWVAANDGITQILDNEEV